MCFGKRQALFIFEAGENKKCLTVRLAFQLVYNFMLNHHRIIYIYITLNIMVKPKFILLKELIFYGCNYRFC